MQQHAGLEAKLDLNSVYVWGCLAYGHIDVESRRNKGKVVPRAAGYKSFANDIMSPDEFNHLSEKIVPVVINARPFGEYSMVDIDDKGGIQVFVKDLLDAGLLNGDVLTCTGESLEKQIQSLKPAKPDGKVIFSVESPFKPSGGLRVLGGNLSPEFSAVFKLVRCLFQ